MKSFAVLAMLLVSAAAFAGEICHREEFPAPEGIYVLESGPASSPSFIQLDQVFSEDGGKLISILGLKFKDSSMTAQKLSEMAKKDLMSIHETANAGNKILSANFHFPMARVRPPMLEVCRNLLVGWETVTFDQFGFDRTANKLMFVTKQEKSVYLLVVPNGSAFPNHSW
jgi:hypothetical protein